MKEVSPLDGYYVAQVCINGHSISSGISLLPEQKKSHCLECGNPTINTCQECNFPIRGSSYRVISNSYTPPKYCESYGKPYPWTESKLIAADELSGFLDELNANEKEELRKGIRELTSDSPRMPLAVTKIKRLLSKAGEDGYKLAIKIISDITTEAAKKELGL